jgi:hypothetical protein
VGKGGGDLSTKVRDLSTKVRDLSTEVETPLWRGRLVYGGGGSSTEGETSLQMTRLFCGGTDSSTEGETSLWRGDSSTEGETRLQRGRPVLGLYWMPLRMSKMGRTQFMQNIYI